MNLNKMYAKTFLDTNLLFEHGIVVLSRVTDRNEIICDDGHLLGEEGADVEVELDHDVTGDKMETPGNSSVLSELFR